MSRLRKEMDTSTGDSKNGCTHQRGDAKMTHHNGVSATDAPLWTPARIVCCCDAYNAMTTTRSYRSAMTSQAALQEVRAHSGTQFDPAVVEALTRIEERAQTASPAA